MSKKQTKKQTKKTNEKNVVTIRNEKNELIEIERDTLRDTLLNELRIATKQRNTRECKRLRNKLRKQCNHYGALRQRTYIDKSTNDNKRIIVNDNVDLRVTTNDKRVITKK